MLTILLKAIFVIYLLFACFILAMLIVFTIPDGEYGPVFAVAIYWLALTFRKFIQRPWLFDVIYREVMVVGIVAVMCAAFIMPLFLNG